jgi:two-component system, chemotaxis family, chemotaxis protein CheY
MTDQNRFQRDAPNRGGAQPAKADGGGPRVLAVDDSSVARRQIKEALEAAGVKVAEAAEGVEALWRAREQRFDLVITDIHMPAMDGLELIRELRKIPGYEHTPVYVLTSDGSRERLAEGRAAGATAWIVKPANMPLLVNAVVDAINKRRSSG